MTGKLKCPNCETGVLIDRKLDRYSVREEIKCPECETILTLQFRERAVLFGSVAGSTGALVI